MSNKPLYYARASFALLLFVFLGYVVKFYPNQLVGFDSAIQTAVRGHLPATLTSFFARLTVIGDPLFQLLWVSLFALAFYSWKNWRGEAALVVVSGLSSAILIVLFKYVYARVRPSLPHLVKANGYSFPSGHSVGAMLIFGCLLIVATQRMAQGWAKRLVQGSLLVLIALVGLSRIYLGVHYPSDILAGFALGLSLIHI